VANYTPPPDSGFAGVLGQMIADLITYAQIKKARAAEKRLRMVAARQTVAAERESSAQRERWLKFVRQQNSKGTGGDLDQRRAREALRGRGGRRSKFDDRMV
jgi:hypothetical protein